MNKVYYKVGKNTFIIEVSNTDLAKVLAQYKVIKIVSI